MLNLKKEGDDFYNQIKAAWEADIPLFPIPKEIS